MIRRRIAALALSLVASGCAGSPAAPLRVGVLQFPSYELFFLAEERALFDPDRIRLVGYRSPVDAVRAYESGLLDAITLTLEDALELEEPVPEHRVVLVLDESHGADAIVARPELASLAALRGRRLAVEASALGRYLTQRAFELAGLSADEVVLVPADVADHERVYLEGAADAVLTYEPIRTRLLAAGGRELFSSREIPGEIVDVLLTRAELVATRLPELGELARGWFAAVAELAAHPEQAAVVPARREQVTPRQFLASLEGLRLMSLAENRALLSTDDRRLIEVVERRCRRLAAMGFAAPSIDPRRLLSDAVVLELAP